MKKEHSLLQDALEIMRKSVNGAPYNSQTELARASGESEANISRWLSGAVTPTLRRLEPVLMCLGVRFALPKRGVCISQTDIEAPENLLSRVDSWKILQEKDELPPIIMLRIPRGDHSMQPIIHPDDIVAVDTVNKNLKERSLYLVECAVAGQKLHAIRRAFFEKDAYKNTIILCPDNIHDGYRPLTIRMEDTQSILGTVKNIIKKA